MENFFNYLSKNLDQDEVDIWFNANNIIPEKLELYYDFDFKLININLIRMKKNKNLN